MNELGITLPPSRFLEIDRTPIRGVVIIEQYGRSTMTFAHAIQDPNLEINQAIIRAFGDVRESRRDPYPFLDRDELGRTLLTALAMPAFDAFSYEGEFQRRLLTIFRVWMYK